MDRAFEQISRIFLIRFSERVQRISHDLDLPLGNLTLILAALLCLALPRAPDRCHLLG